MSQETLRTQIVDLQETLKQTTAVSDETKRRLAELDKEIHPIIENPASLDHASLSARLEGMIAAFETDHPVLSQHLQTIVNTLSTMGI